jgi:pyruvate, water dikinase
VTEDQRRQTAGEPAEKWRVIVDFLRRTDPGLLEWITRKMLNHVRWRGVAGADALLPPGAREDAHPGGQDENRPLVRVAFGAARLPTDAVFELAARHLSEEEILDHVQMWTSQDKASFLVRLLEDQGSSLGEITEALDRFHGLAVDEADLPHSVQTMVRVALLRRFFTDQIDYINSARRVATVRDFHSLSRRLVAPPRSHGRLGGKSAGLFLAQRIVETSPEFQGVLSAVRVPRTWYLASDAVLAFIRYNNLEDIYDQKYLETDRIRQQYPHVIQVFKSSDFPPELRKGLGAALDDLGDGPLIVRSSSLLEDRTGAVFSGKYKSLFLANQGTKQERLRALQDAVAEVYASIFSPDPLAYRAERNLLDVHEEMGIMIQRVVGRRVGRYFLPSYSGVALSRNEFRWSPRIRREDGLVRLVPGLGTRAVDRTTDDYSILLAPGQPGLRVNTTAAATLRYAPRFADVIDLERNEFTTVPVLELLRDVGNQIPDIRKMVSIVEDGHLRRPGGLGVDFGRQEAVVTFEGLASDSPFLARISALLELLGSRLGMPVDVEFAADGEHLYLLQCRPQSFSGAVTPVAIPTDVSPERVIFTARGFISGAVCLDLTHLVYVVPDRYAALPDRATMLDVGRAVGALNGVLPRRGFLLMGPGRWGSRGDIQLGVSVTYADISNTAILAEVARRQGSYVPDLSFGTHFFQDLVEAGIRYLPLYPDEPGNRFNDAFLLGARNRLEELTPEFAHLADTLRVLDIPSETGGQRLRICMNGELDEAMGFLVDGQAPAT